MADRTPRTTSTFEQQGGEDVPSYRVRMIVGDLQPGADPAAVLPAAAEAARQRTTVEATQLEIVRGRPRVTVRYLADDDVSGAMIGRAVVARTDELAVVETSRVTRRFGTRWYPMR